MKELVLEYVFESVSVKSLWKNISTAPGLAGWYADKVDIENDIITFVWNKEVLKAKIVDRKENRLFGFEFLDEGKSERITLEITFSELTKDTILRVEELIEENEEIETKSLWDKQIGNLQRKLGVFTQNI